MKGSPFSVSLSVALVLAIAFTLVGAAYAAVDLAWWPEAQIVHQGSQVSVGLYAFSAAEHDWPIAGIQAIVFHSTDNLGVPYLTYQGLCRVGAYDWLDDGMFVGQTPHINDNIYDGNMQYSAMAWPGIPTMIPPSGLLATTFLFNADTLVANSTITIPKIFVLNDRIYKTVVFDGTIPNTDVTGQLGMAKVTVVPQGVDISEIENSEIVSSVAEAKLLGNETQVAIISPIVTRSFDGYFYIEDENRASGIRVNFDGQAAPAEGTKPFVWGVIRVVDGERVVDNADVVHGGAAGIPGSLAMNLEAVFTGLNPQGLLVTLSGRAESTPGASGFLLYDGSPNPVYVELHGFTAPPDQAFVSVTGALGADSDGPVIRVNNPADLNVRTVP